ncbi:MATE family efflux transporter [Flavobacterium sp. Fl-77]|uniref:Multidrug-efflux transporter n=1 Tax=Flavobacterium flavipigmentatum TaxID=2893884 RepID=A0AAJ2VYE9_9FLAO|nr:MULTISPECIES: MATE family efflux transporter [unclassified Flavobacterium]MDX6182892.1 MATE family efflux transporter [Flavobacterium sp. Fl-33]MDX6186345.1 MATE family efflux transporter [Flavobacterium sp. Fl-77]UFH37867.1 MATE family efflux transporter [Flavobacterium sp. F-70]
MKEAILKTRSFLGLISRSLSGTETNFTSGSINKAIILLSVPMVAELLMESLFVCSNLFFVSRLGTSAISIAGATTTFITFCYSVSIGLGIAASAMISRRIGEKEFKIAGQTAMQVIYITTPIAIIISVVCSVWATEIMTAMGLSKAMVEEGKWYGMVMFASSGFLILRIVINGIFRGAGDASTAMRILWLSNALNIVLCPLFIFGWGPIPAYGLLGVGLATLIARVIGVIYQAWYLVKGKTVLRIAKTQLLFDLAIFKRVVKLAFGGTVQFIIPASSWVFMIKIMSHFGENALAGYILAQRVASIATMPAWGLGNAAGILTGQNLGAKQPERAEKSVWRAGMLNMGFLILIGICWIFMAAPVVKFFTDIPEVISFSTRYIHFISIAYILLGYTMVISRALNAAGEVKVVTWLYILMFYIVQIPLAYSLGIAFELGANGVFTAILLSEIVLAVACIIVFRKGKWKHTKV